MRRIYPIFILVLTIFATAASASAQKQRFVGTFVAEDPNTPGITRLELADDDTLNVWGRCQPADCDWGPERVASYSARPDDDLSSSAKALSAVYVTDYAVTILIIRPLKDDRLSVDVFKRFTDRSGRSAYSVRYILTRENLSR